jgi:hypothetical protein
MEAEHEFTLILDGISELGPSIVDALFEAGCDDATLSSCDGVVSMDFDRIAPTMQDAVVSAIQDVRKANIGARVVRVEECQPENPAVTTVINGILSLAQVFETNPKLKNALVLVK